MLEWFREIMQDLQRCQDVCYGMLIGCVIAWIFVLLVFAG
jgi:hypothetical protein